MLQIRTTGIDDYLDGSANIKMLVIGGPGVGKTRMASYWPKPIYLDCENGRGSLVDRNMPYIEVKNSKNMLDSLELLKSYESQIKVERPYQTVVIDTIDSFQRKVKDEWLQQTKAGVFTGYDAWGFLDSKMQILTTRLLNLDYNVIVLAHHEDKKLGVGDDAKREFKLQLQGQVHNQIFNDLDLVGFMEPYWDNVEGEGRIQRRGLSFQPTPDKPFLKDRFNCTPKWMPIEFSDEDYQQMWRAFMDRPGLEDLPESQVVADVPDHEVLAAAAAAAANAPHVIGPIDGGPLQPPADQPQQAPDVGHALIELEKMTVAQLVAKAKSIGLSPRGNQLKAEILADIKTTLADDAAKASQTAQDKPAEPAPAQTTTSSEPIKVDPKTGEILSPEQVAERLGAEVIEVIDHPPTDTPNPPAGAAVAGGECVECHSDVSADLADPVRRNYVRLGRVKFKRNLCANCVQKLNK